jgi:hypothetical protein
MAVEDLISLARGPFQHQFDFLQAVGRMIRIRGAYIAVKKEFRHNQNVPVAPIGSPAYPYKQSESHA